MCLLLIYVPGCLDSFDFRQRMYQASFAMRISVSFSRLLLNCVTTYGHITSIIIPNSSSVRSIWPNDDSLSATDREKHTSLSTSNYTFIIDKPVLFFMRDRTKRRRVKCSALTVSGLRLLSGSVVVKHSFTMAFLD